MLLHKKYVQAQLNNLRSTAKRGAKRVIELLSPRKEKKHHRTKELVHDDVTSVDDTNSESRK
jgi:hypothetical protein